jgi:uncharacterized protein (DUF885 family)
VKGTRSGTLSSLVACAISLSALAAAQGPERFSGPSSQDLHQLFGVYWEWRLAEEPELATRVGRTEHNGRWTDWSKEARERRRRAREEYLRQAMLLSPGTLTPEDRLSAFLLEYELATALETERYTDLVRQISQSDGAHNEVFTVIDQMPAQSVADYENILARLDALPTYIDQAIALAQEQLASGLAQPHIAVDLMLDQLVAQRRYSAAESPLLVAFRRFPDAMPATDRERLRARAVVAYEATFVPAWTRLEAFLRDTYRPQARKDVSIGSLASGRAAYAALIRYYTTTRTPAEEIHQRGLEEVARIERLMQVIARAEGFRGPVGEFERELGNRPGMRFASQDEMLARARDVLARVQPELPQLFRRLPRMSVGVRPIPPDREASTASNYTAGTADGARPGWFNMNTYRPQDQFTYELEALVLHETVPGHHLQVALARELSGLPQFRVGFQSAAFGEGWALYAESLGSALGPVYTDPATRFGQLASEQFRAVRLVVDTGLHALGWSRERARAYFSDHVPGQSLAEVDRYIARPGQALAYKLGELKIKDLRSRAEKAIGPRFDIRDFHDAVLSNGRLPLDLLEEQIDAYITAARRD